MSSKHRDGINTRQVVESVWEAPLYLSYGQTESFGTLGAECQRKNGYHRNDLFFLFETPETDAGGYGELVYTTLVRDVMPLIRYRSTDLTSLLDEPCVCGLFAKRIAKIRSRTDEIRFAAHKGSGDNHCRSNSRDAGDSER